jgi:hypothetical protein
VWYFTQYPTHFIILIGTPEPTRADLAGLEEAMEGIRSDLRTIRVDSVYEVASMLLLGEQDVDDLVAGAPLHTDNHPILEFSDMGLYMTSDVEPNLERLLSFQDENLGAYFDGSEEQLAILEDHFEEYTNHYRNYVNQYERRSGRRDGSSR